MTQGVSSLERHSYLLDMQNKSRNLRVASKHNLDKEYHTEKH